MKLKINLKNMIIIMILVLAMFVSVQNVSAELNLDNINFDPAIISAGDEVDIVIQFHDDTTSISDDFTMQDDLYFKVELLPDDSLTKKYLTIQDAEGDNMQGMIFSGERYNKVFRVKVNYDAPAGNYQFLLKGQWYKDNKPINYYEQARFRMPVKKEGIIMDIATINTVPAEVRPGDEYVKITARVENTGEKNAKATEIKLQLPEGLESSYTNDNRVWIGRVNAGESKEAVFFVDVDEDAEPKTYNINYDFNYMDVDNNKYHKIKELPFLLKRRPYLEIEASEGSGLAGNEGKLKIKVKNIGTESAESVDVRILKQNSQPFELDVRSDYIGELKPGETGEAIFRINTLRDAEIKTHNLKLIIRAKGDSDEGDDNIYTFERRAEFEVTGVAKNKLKTYGLIAVAMVILIILINLLFNVFKKKKK